MLAEATLLFIFLGVCAGILIGAAGIGGVILVPLLVYFAGADIHQSIASSNFCFLISGIVGTVLYTKRRIIKWEYIANLTYGAIPGALMGTALLHVFDAMSLKLIIGALCIFSACKELSLKPAKVAVEETEPKKPELFFIGLVTGSLSALSGTGGPLVLIPLLALTSIPLLITIGLAQVIQLPIAITATLSNTITGLINWPMAAAIAVGISFGTFLGSEASKKISTEFLRKLVAFLLILAGTLISGLALKEQYF